MRIGNSYNSGFGFNSAFDKKSGKSEKSWKNSMLSQMKGGKISVKKAINASKYMTRVAQAKTPSQVSAIIRMARADIQFAKSCDSDEAEIEKAIRILKQVISKSQTKIKRLRTEEELERQEQLARNARKRKLEAEIRDKKNKKRSARHGEEAADTMTNEEATLERTIMIEAAGFDAVSVQGISGETAAADAAAGGEGVSSIEAAL